MRFKWDDVREFFEDTDGALSISRLLNFLSFFPASYVFIKNPTETMAGLYLGTYGVIYIGGKIIDAAQSVKTKKPPAISINQPGGNTDVTVTSPAPVGG